MDTSVQILSQSYDHTVITLDDDDLHENPCTSQEQYLSDVSSCRGAEISHGDQDQNILSTNKSNKQRKTRPRFDGTFVPDKFVRHCLENMQLFFLRYTENMISKRMLSFIHHFGAYYNIPFFIPKLRNLNALAPDPTLFIKEINALEKKYGEYVWDLYYISGSEFLLQCILKYQRYFSYRVLFIVRILYRVVLENDWDQVSIFLENIQLDSHKKQIYSKEYFVFFVQSLYPYLPYFFLVCLQRILQFQKSPELTSVGYINILKKFNKTIVSKSFPNHFIFYLLQILIYHIANLQLDFCGHESIENITNPNSEWLRILDIYKFCMNFELYAANVDIDAQRDLATSYSAILKAILFEPQYSVGLISLFICLSKLLDMVEILYDELFDASYRCPSLLVWVYPILLRFDLTNEANGLLESVLYSSTEVFALAEFILDVVESRTSTPENFGDVDDVFRTNLRILFNRLDYGKNRTEHRTWRLLSINLTQAQSHMKEFIEELWRERKLWWPKFHLCQVRKKCRKYRDDVFEILKQLN